MYMPFVCIKYAGVGLISSYQIKQHAEGREGEVARANDAIGYHHLFTSRDKTFTHIHNQLTCHIRSLSLSLAHFYFSPIAHTERLVELHLSILIFPPKPSTQPNPPSSSKNNNNNRSCVNVSQSTLVKAASKPVMPAGSSIGK